jgi:hypothetical protein
LFDYKLELPYEEAVVQNTISSFVVVNREVGFSADSLDDTASIIGAAARSILRRVTHDLDLVGINPRHGPGVVSTGQDPSEKPFFRRRLTKLEKKYPFIEYFHYSRSHTWDRIDQLEALESVEYGQAKLVPVPKDSRGPRLISAEPIENQWIQQGQMSNLVRHLETNEFTKGRINFRDQTVNRDLALQASSDGKLVTLDMKEASDRVSRDLVQYLFHDHLFEYLDASRSPCTLLPDGTSETLNMFAPMGSAISFPWRHSYFGVSV